MIPARASREKTQSAAREGRHFVGLQHLALREGINGVEYVAHFHALSLLVLKDTVITLPVVATGDRVGVLRDIADMKTYLERIIRRNFRGGLQPVHDRAEDQRGCGF